MLKNAPFSKPIKSSDMKPKVNATNPKTGKQAVAVADIKKGEAKFADGTKIKINCTKPAKLVD